MDKETFGSLIEALDKQTCKLKSMRISKMSLLGLNNDSCQLLGL